MKASDKKEAWVYLLLTLFLMFITVYIAAFLVHRIPKLVTLMTAGELTLSVLMIFLFIGGLTIYLAFRIDEEKL